MCVSLPILRSQWKDGVQSAKLALGSHSVLPTFMCLLRPDWKPQNLYPAFPKSPRNWSTWSLLFAVYLHPHREVCPAELCAGPHAEHVSILAMLRIACGDSPSITFLFHSAIPPRHSFHPSFHAARTLECVAQLVHRKNNQLMAESVVGSFSCS